MSDYTCLPSFWSGICELLFVSLYSCIILGVPTEWKYLRLTSIVPLAYITYMARTSLVSTCQNPHWRGLGVPLLYLQFFSAIDLIATSCASFTQVPKSPKPGSFITKPIQTVALLWNLRRVGTIWATTKIRPTFCGTRRSFLMRQFPVLCIAYLYLDISVSLPKPDPLFVHPSKQILWPLSGLSTQDFVFRFIASISFWITVAVLLYTIHTTVIITGAVLNWWEPADCAPLFGYVQNAYSIRKFWGSVWHQCLRQSLTGVSDLICHSVLRIPRGTLLSRYAKLNTIFALSGILHYASDLAMGVPPQKAGGFAFYQLQALVIMVEDFAQFLIGHRLQRSLGKRLCRAAGYFWVLLVLAWSTPTWFYPTQRLGVDPAALLPFRIIPKIVGLR
ncbi:hypothetical protein PspLS_08177 [Pyricularia sp. CBS 133598]|nr:hypothetical protein PspLS_08177 [Pyricularia sp. CBS 133598]